MSEIGHSKNESTWSTMKKAFGWDHTPKFFKNPFVLGFFGAVTVAMVFLNDRIEPDIALMKRDRELREERYLEQRDRERLQRLAQKDQHMAEVLKELEQAENVKSPKL